MRPPSPTPPKSPIFRTLARLSTFLAPYRARFVIAGIALLVAAGCTLAVGQGLKLVIDRGFAAANGAELDRALLALLVIIAVIAIATYVRFYNISWIGERVTADLRRRVFDHLLTLSPGFFEVTRTGEVISRLTNDTTMLETVIGSSLSFALRNMVLGVGALVLLTLTSLKLTLLVIAGLPVVVIPIILFGRRVRRLSRASQDRVADSGAYVDEAIHEIRTVQAYVHEPQDRDAYAHRVEQAFSTGVER
ncbi:MAG TPA: ABC transporter transmembrane domain-containing protein, partial [Casimicrobiaceae bacterium]|nr:ABC transporter transmembrane domain-containing protein [Casimicrobiaceae bacterium]